MDKPKPQYVKQQHYLPNRAYLVNFTNNNGQFEVYRFVGTKLDFLETAKQFTSSPDNMAKEGYIYEAPHIEINGVEKTLQSIEDIYIEVMDNRIKNRLPLSDDDYEKIALFMEVLNARVPANREHWNKQLSKVSDMGVQIALAHNAPEAGKKHAAEMDEVKKRTFADVILMTVQINMWQHSDVAILNIPSSLSGMEFITSDNPVAVRDYAMSNSFYGIVPLSKTIETTIPISKKQAVLINNVGISGYHDIDANFVREINHRTIVHASDFIISSKPLDKRFYDDVTKRQPQSILLKLMALPKGKPDFRLEEIDAAKSGK